MIKVRVDDTIDNVKEKCKSIEYKKDISKYTRERKLTQQDLVWYITMQKGRTTNLELEEYLNVKHGNYETEITKQAFSKQRQYLKPKIFEDLSSDYLKSFYRDNTERINKYKDFYVLAIDGSMFELPNTKDIRDKYQCQNSKKGKRPSARARVSGIYDVENGFMVNAVIAECSKGEIKLSYENIKEMIKILPPKECIVIFDRGYPCIELLLFLEQLGIKYIFRLQYQTYIEEKKKAKTNDEIIELKLTKDRIRRINSEGLKEIAINKGSIYSRLTKIILDTGEEEHLLSNIDKSIIPCSEMKEVYFKRWKIEISYDILKNKLHVENFTGKTQITIEQDFYSQIYLFNILQDIKKSTNDTLDKPKDLKYEYKVNINILAGLLKNMLIYLMFVEDDDEKEKIFHTIIKKAKKNLIPIKPDRSFKRKGKYKGSNKYKTNIRPNM